MFGDSFFDKGTLFEFLEQQKSEIAELLSRKSPEDILGMSEADLRNALVCDYTLDPPALHKEAMRQEEPREVPINVSGARDEYPREPGRRYQARGSRITVVVPFTGDARLFYPQPSRFGYPVPHVQVSGSELRLVYEVASPDAAALRREVNDDIGNIEWYLEAVAQDVAQHNQQLPIIVTHAVDKRRKQALDHKGLVEGIGIPLHRREDPPMTYQVPVVRRRPAIEAVPVSKGQPESEYYLGVADYEQVLTIIQNMALVMERSPSAFEQMKEEDLRVHFLVQLNGQYEGEAAGEVFNLAGKTDILIRHAGKNIFIAECKYWDGAESLTDAIGQVLSYATWRDTKTAIILFVRRKGFSEVLRQIPGIVREHSAYKRDDTTQGETQFRFILAKPEDRARELILTVCAFHVPSAGAA